MARGPPPAFVNCCMMTSFAGFIYLGIFAIALATKAPTLEPYEIKDRGTSSVVFFICAGIYLVLFIVMVMLKRKQKLAIRDQDNKDRMSTGSEHFYKPMYEQESQSEDARLSKPYTENDEKSMIVTSKSPY